ncbi:MAG: thiosulfate oxidation carrier protein SoxY [Pseudomonadota bacterium]|nr:thiosulfate oxidation carrier protein SoxY [Pseudomonadota bacterium]
MSEATIFPRATAPRRSVLLYAAGAAALGAGLRPARAADTPAAAPAPAWPKAAFEGKTEDVAVKALYDRGMTPSDKITLELPEIAENGAVVPVAVSTTLPNVTSISLLVPKNPFTLAASYILSEGTAPNISSRLKMGATSDVVAVVESDGKLYNASKEVKVTLGGCGG